MIRNQNHSIDIDKFQETIDSHEYVNADRFPHSGSKRFKFVLALVAGRNRCHSLGYKNSWCQSVLSLVNPQSLGLTRVIL
jgi:hypothetical protein